MLGEPDFCFTELGCPCLRIWAASACTQLNGPYRPRPSAPETFSIQIYPCCQTTDRHRPSVSAVCTVLFLHSQCAAPTIQQSNNPTIPVQQCMVHQSATIGGYAEAARRLAVRRHRARRGWRLGRGLVLMDDSACRVRLDAMMESERGARSGLGHVPCSGTVRHSDSGTVALHRSAGCGDEQRRIVAVLASRHPASASGIGMQQTSPIRQRRDDGMESA